MTTTELEKVESKKRINVVHESVFWEDDDPRRFIGKLGNEPIIDNTGVNLSEDSQIWVFNGWRGAGKTTSMTFFSMRANYLYNMRIIANYPIEYILAYSNGESKLVKAETLDLYKLLCFDQDYKNCLIVIDEAPDIISHMAAMTWKNRLLNIWIRQLRKNHNSLFLGAQQFELIDKSMRWQVDILAECEDARYKYPHQLSKGELVFIRFLDNSGVWTGKTWRQEQAYKRAKHDPLPVGEEYELWPRFLWGDDKQAPVFDSYFVQDIWESLRRVDIKLGTYKVGDTRGNGKTEYFDRAMETVQAITGLESQKVLCSDFYKSIGELDTRQKDRLSKALHKAGIGIEQTTGRKRYYDFSQFNLGDFEKAFSE